MCQEVLFNEHDRLILINIIKSFRQNRPIYESARYAWRVKRNRANNADFIIAHASGKILNVFKLDKIIGWREAIRSNFEDFPFDDWNDRFAFQKDNTIIDAEMNRFLGKKLPIQYNGKNLYVRNPILYINI